MGAKEAPFLFVRYTNFICNGSHFTGIPADSFHLLIKPPHQQEVPRWGPT